MPTDQGRGRGPTRHSSLSTLFTFSGFLLMFGLLMFLGYTTTTETSGVLWWREERVIPMSERVSYLQGAIALWSAAAVLGAIALWFFVRAPERKLNKLKRYVPILKGVERIPVHQIASITDSNLSVVFRDIQTMIDTGLIQDFYVDYQAGEVVSKKYVPDHSHKTVVRCPSCGANSEVIVGITQACAYCGQFLEV